MDFDDEVESVWAMLVETGAVVLDGITDDGEPVYIFDMEILKEVHPDLYHAHLDEVDEAVLGLVEKGLATLDFSGDEVAAVLTEKGMEWAEVAIQAINET